MKKLVAFLVITLLFVPIFSFSVFSQEQEDTFSAQSRVAEICVFIENKNDSSLNVLGETEIIEYKNYVLAKNKNFLLIQGFNGDEMYVDIDADGVLDRYIRNGCPDPNSRTLAWNAMYAFKDIGSLKKKAEIRTSVRPVNISFFDLSDTVTFFDFSSGYLVLDSVASQKYREVAQQKYEEILQVKLR